jgi:uncharacterized membrane protein
MEKIKQIIEQIDTFLKPYIDKLIAFLSREQYVIYGAIGVLLVLLVLFGLFTFLKKFPKTFLFLVIILSAAALIAYFLTYKV